MKATGCYITPMTGYSTEYPECRNYTEYRNLQLVHEIISTGKSTDWGHYQKRVNKREKCTRSCNKKIYSISHYNKKQIKHHLRFMKSKPEAIIRFGLDRSVMYFSRVNEESAMTTEDLVSNVGGILGIFLGVSCFSGVSGLMWLYGYINSVANGFFRRFV